MATANILPNGRNQFFSTAGTPLVGGKLYTYEPGVGVTTPKATYSDAGASSTNTNPVVMDARGEATIFWTGAYNVRLESADGSLIWSVDNINLGEDGTLTLTEVLDRFALSDGATLSGYKRPESTSVATTVAKALYRRISVFDFMTAAQIADVQAKTLTLDVTTVVQNFIDACDYAHGFLEPGAYKITSSLVIDPTVSCTITGGGWDINGNTGTMLRPTMNAPCIVMENATAFNYDNDILLADFCINGNNVGSGQHGVYARRIPIKLNNLYIVNCQHGMRLRDAFGAIVTNNVIANNYLHGIWFDDRANQVLCQANKCNGNARSTGGYGGIAFTKSGSGLESLGVTLLDNDTTGNGVVSLVGSGVILQGVSGLTISGHYGESNKTFGIYADNSNASVKITGGYHTQEEISLQEVAGGLEFSFNRMEGFTVNLSKLNIKCARAAHLDLQGNSFGGTQPTIYALAEGAGNGTTIVPRMQQINTASPASLLWTGNYKRGDIIWHAAPNPAGNIGWVCTVAGAAGVSGGTWNVFGTIT